MVLITLQSELHATQGKQLVIQSELFVLKSEVHAIQSEQLTLQSVTLRVSS